MPPRAGTLMHPGRHPARGFRFPPRRKPYLAAPIFTPTIPGVGSAGVATFVLSLEPGAKLVFGWATDIITMYDGTEQRISLFGAPKRKIEGTAFLVTSADRDAKGALMRAAAAGSTFALALPMEATTLTADALGTVVAVPSTATLDWALPGQRVALLGIDGAILFAVVQNSTATTITLGVADSTGALTSAQTLGGPGRAGALIMPILPVLLEASQGFARYPSRVDLWSVHAQSQAFGWAAVDAMGVGTSVATYTLGGPDVVTDITDADLLLWDRPNGIDGTAAESMLSGADLVDLGAVPLGAGARIAPQWQRSLKYTSSSQDDWQWFKAFLHLCRGRQRAFLLSTNHADLLYLATTSSGIMVSSRLVSGAGDYVSWYASLAHRRLAITLSDDSIIYVAVTALVDNGDGTLSLTLDSPVLGTVAKVSLLEQVRFANDEIAATWDGAVFLIDEPVVTTTDVISPPSLYMFDTQVSVSLSSVSTANATAALGISTVLNVTWVNGVGAESQGTIGTLTATGGNVDGMVVMIPCQVSVSGTLTTSTAHDTGTPTTSRFFNVGLGNVSTQVNGALVYIYSGAIGRWLLIGAA